MDSRERRPSAWLPERLQARSAPGAPSPLRSQPTARTVTSQASGCCSSSSGLQCRRGSWPRK
eukprot:44594-Chlamydomonas_euryale.AAC.1